MPTREQHIENAFNRLRDEVIANGTSPWPFIYWKLEELSSGQRMTVFSHVEEARRVTEAGVITAFLKGLAIAEVPVVVRS